MRLPKEGSDISFSYKYRAGITVLNEVNNRDINVHVVIRGDRNKTLKYPTLKIKDGLIDGMTIMLTMYALPSVWFDYILQPS